MAKIFIRRGFGWFNMIRQYKIILDGKIISTIGNSETKELEIEAGKHELKAKIDWCGSAKIAIDVTESDMKFYKVRSAKMLDLLAIGIFVLLLSLAFLRHELYPFIDYSKYIFIATLIYYLTIGRNQYLVLKERKETDFKK